MLWGASASEQWRVKAATAALVVAYGIMFFFRIMAASDEMLTMRP